ncbi:MAG TPA: DJ-1 family glyoxalase III [Clostridia bacterium]
MKKVLVHLADGFEEIEAITVIDVLRRAGINTVTVSMSGKKEVSGAHHIVVEADALFDNALYKDADMIVLPGGGPGTKNLKAHTGLAAIIKEFNESRKWIAAICAAPTVLGCLGILNGKNAVCYPGCEDELTGAATREDAVMVDGHIITSRAPGTAFEFSFKLVELLLGSAEVAQLKEGMLA